MKSKTQVPKYKKEAVKELAELAKSKKTILIASIKNIPASQFQEIGKKLRGKAIIKVPKKSLVLLALENSKNENMKKLRENIGDSVAVLFSDLDSFELASKLEESKSPAKAKAGQEAPEDIEIPEGPTDLVPGPAVSELGALGIQIQIEKGKISIKEAKVIAKKGEKISQKAADLMGKLDIKPFSIGFIPLCALDMQEGKFYAEIKVDRKGTIETLKIAYSKALPFAVAVGYATEDTIKFLIGKAGIYEKALGKFLAEKTEDKNSEDKNKENTEEDKISEEEK